MKSTTAIHSHPLLRWKRERTITGIIYVLADLPWYERAILPGPDAVCHPCPNHQGSAPPGPRMHLGKGGEEGKEGSFTCGILRPAKPIQAHASWQAYGCHPAIHQHPPNRHMNETVGGGRKRERGDGPKPSHLTTGGKQAARGHHNGGAESAARVPSHHPGLHGLSQGFNGEDVVGEGGEVDADGVKLGGSAITQGLQDRSVAVHHHRATNEVHGIIRETQRELLQFGALPCCHGSGNGPYACCTRGMHPLESWPPSQQ